MTHDDRRPEFAVTRGMPGRELFRRGRTSGQDAGGRLMLRFDKEEKRMNPPIFLLELTTDEEAAGFYRTEIEHVNLKHGGKDRVPGTEG
jgi:hypothetical protein